MTNEAPKATSQSEKNWLRRHDGHAIYFVKRWRSVVALGAGPGELWACDCKGDGDRHWFRIQVTDPFGTA